MKVLIVGFDLFASVGGGQTFYQNIIRRHPEIEFHYFRENEAEDQPKPANAKSLRFADCELPEGYWNYFDPSVPRWAIGACFADQRVALSVAGKRYDLVDIPDYSPYGSFLRPAFARYDVTGNRFALSMHGVMSTTLALNWGADGSLPVSPRALELFQYRAVDTRYFISSSYQDEWRTVSPFESHYLDPMWIFDVVEPVPYRPTTDQPILRFIGRTEKRKGPHLFLNMLWWLPKNSYARAEIIGPDCAGPHGESSTQILEGMCQTRGLNVSIEKALTAKELAQRYGERTITFAPSIYDTLNLVGLESLFAGCPAVIGNGAGLCRYLNERFPELPYTVFETGRFFENLPRLTNLFANYDHHREALMQGLRRIDVRPRGPGLVDIYRSSADVDSSAWHTAETWYASVMKMLEAPRRMAA